jgi:hypothetical protein
MTSDAAFGAKYSDGSFVLHKGRVVYERYDPGIFTELQSRRFQAMRLSRQAGAVGTRR